VDNIMNSKPTQLNSTSHLERWLTRGKELKELNHIPDSLKKSSRFLNVDNVHTVQ